MIPKTFYDLESNLYLLDDSNTLTRVCSSKLLTKADENEPQTVPIRFYEIPTRNDDSYFIPVRGKTEFVRIFPSHPRETSWGSLKSIPRSI